MNKIKIIAVLVSFTAILTILHTHNPNDKILIQYKHKDREIKK